jgi:mycoredoxin
VTDAAEQQAPALTIYSTVWCGYCQRLKAQMSRAGVDYDEVDINEEAGAEELVKGVNGGHATVPTLVFSDGSVLTNPSLKAVQARLAELS